MSASVGPVPATWRTAVVAILREGDTGKIMLRQRAWRDWQATFPMAWRYNLYEALAEALEQNDLHGKRCEMKEAGETYAFFFTYQGRKLYGKINLTRPGYLVIIYSAHRPLRGNEL
jgi:hypothetical protein